MARFPLGMYTLPDGVRTRHDGSKSTPSSVGLPVTRPFIRLIVGLRGGTSGGAEGGTPSRRQPLVLFFTAPRSIPLSRHSMVALNSYEFIFCVLLPGPLQFTASSSPFARTFFPPCPFCDFHFSSFPSTLFLGTFHSIKFLHSARCATALLF